MPAFCVFPSLSGSGSQRLARTPPGAACLFLPQRAAQAARGLSGLSHGCGAPFPSTAPARVAGWVSGSLQTGTRGLFAVWEGVASLGLSLPLAPPPASFLQRGWAGSSLEFLSPFVLRTAGGVFQLVNFSSFSHSLKKAPSDCSQGLLAGPYPKQCRLLLSVSPPLAGGGCRRLGYFSAGSCF